MQAIPDEGDGTFELVHCELCSCAVCGIQDEQVHFTQLRHFRKRHKNCARNEYLRRAWAEREAEAEAKRSRLASAGFTEMQMNVLFEIFEERTNG